MDRAENPRWAGSGRAIGCGFGSGFRLPPSKWQKSKGSLKTIKPVFRLP